MSRDCLETVDRPTQLICISDIYLLSTDKYKRRSRAICYPHPPFWTVLKKLRFWFGGLPFWNIIKLWNLILLLIQVCGSTGVFECLGGQCANFYGWFTLGGFYCWARLGCPWSCLQCTYLQCMPWNCPPIGLKQNLHRNATLNWWQGLLYVQTAEELKIS